MEFVDEEHVTVLEIGEERGQVAGTREHRTRGHTKTRAHLAGHDARERRLAQSGRSGEEQMIGALVSSLGRSEHDLEVTNQVALTDEVLERLGTQRHFGATFQLDDFGRHHVLSQLLEVELVRGHDRLNSCRAVRRASDSSAGKTTSFSASRTSWLV